MLSRNDVSRLTMFSLCRTGICDDTIVSCQWRRGDMSFLWPSLLFADRKFIMSQSFLVESEEQRCLAFGSVCLLSTRNWWRHNQFLCRLSRKDISLLANFVFWRPAIGYVTIISHGGRAVKMCRVCQCLLSADMELVTTQSFQVNAEQEICLLFGIVCFLSTRNPWRHNRLFWRPSRKDVSLLAMFAFCQPVFDDVTIIFFVLTEQQICLLFSNVFFLSTMNRWRHNHFLGRAGKKCRICQCLLFAEQE